MIVYLFSGIIKGVTLYAMVQRLDDKLKRFYLVFVIFYMT